MVSPKRVFKTEKQINSKVVFTHSNTMRQSYDFMIPKQQLSIMDQGKRGSEIVVREENGRDSNPTGSSPMKAVFSIP